MYPRQAPSTHTEQLGDEVAVYDAARKRVHALNPTAARVWRQCDGATSPEAMAAALRRDLAVPEAEAVVELTLRHLARAHLLEAPAIGPSDRQGWTRRALHSPRCGGLAAAGDSTRSWRPAPVAAQSIMSADTHSHRAGAGRPGDHGRGHADGHELHRRRHDVAVAVAA